MRSLLLKIYSNLPGNSFFDLFVHLEKTPRLKEGEGRRRGGLEAGNNRSSSALFKQSAD